MSSPPSVKRRWVLYVSGFDPAGPAKYHQLYTEQSALAAPLLNARIEVGERRNQAAHKLAQWPVRYAELNQPTSASVSAGTGTGTGTGTGAGAGAGAVETDYVFARWDDLVRQHWLPLRTLGQIGAFLLAFFATYHLYWRSGALLRMLRLARPPSLALILPWLMVSVGLVVLLLLVGLGIMAGVEGLFYKGKEAVAGIPYARAAIILIVTGCALGALSWHLEKRWHSLWLIRSFIFTRSQALGRTPQLEARLDQHAQRIREAAASGLYDELLIVGHSSGCTMASLALARALPFNPPFDQPLAQPLAHPYEGAVSLLTLGHWWPLLACLPQAGLAHRELAHLSQQPQVKWVDVSAAADGCCFAFKDPLLALPEAIQRECPPLTRPQTVSARWHTLFPAPDYAALKRDRFRFHFQYVFATPVLGDCDFFAITAGPQTLAQRFAQIPTANQK